MELVVIFIIVAPALSLQHRHCSDELDGSVLYETGHSPVYYRQDDNKHSSETEAHSASIESSNDKYILKHAAHESKSRRKNKKYDCICDCSQKCEKLQKCCRPVCSNECDQTEDNSVETQPGLGGGNGNLVFVPYPYPFVVPPPIPPMPMPPMPMPPMPMPPSPNTTSKPTRKLCSSLSRCSIRRQSDLQDDPILDLLQSLRRRQEPPQVNMRPVKGNQIPEYEDIDNQLLDQLIRQRNVKDINS